MGAMWTAMRCDIFLVLSFDSHLKNTFCQLWWPNSGANVCVSLAKWRWLLKPWAYIDCHDTAGASSRHRLSKIWQTLLADIDWYDSTDAASVHKLIKYCSSFCRHRLSKMLQLHLAYSVDTIWGLHGYFRAMPKVAWGRKVRQDH